MVSVTPFKVAHFSNGKKNENAEIKTKKKIP